MESKKYYCLLKVCSRPAADWLVRWMSSGRHGTKLDRPLDGGLLRADGQVVYQILDRIPILLADEGISLA